MPRDGVESAGALLFEAVIVPHRSLTPRGLRILLTGIGGALGFTALRFWLIGAWPIVGFSVVEVGLIMWLIRLNVLQARGSELVLLSERSLRIIRTDPNGNREERLLPSAWLNVTLEESPGRIPRLLLGVRQQREEIGKVLGETAKRDLAKALGEALHRARNPSFDNPQLR